MFVTTHLALNIIIGPTTAASCAILNPNSSCENIALSPHDALKHHFTSLKTDLISLKQGVLECTFPLNWFTNTW